MILCLDLGTKTGFAAHSQATGIVSGVKDFTTKRTEGGGIKFLMFGRWLDSINHGAITEVYWEEVRRHAGTSAAHCYGSFQGVLMAWCEENRIAYSSVPVGTIKRSATGRGNASKQEMIDAAKKLGFDPIDDNQADAIHILRYVMESF